MDNLRKKDKVLIDYEKKAGEIIEKMYKILIRAHRKVDDKAYRNILQELQNT